MTSVLPSTSVFNSIKTISNKAQSLSEMELINELRKIIKDHENEEKKKEEERVAEISRMKKEETINHFKKYKFFNKDLISDNKHEDGSANLHEFSNQYHMRKDSCPFTFTQKAIDEGYDRINYSNIFEKKKNWIEYFHFSQPLKIGDIIDTGGLRHIGWRFVGENNTLHSAHLHDMIDYDRGTIVPIEISSKYMDTLAIYQKEVKQENEDETKEENKKIEYEEKFPAVNAYELPFWDKTVEKYDVPKNSKFFFTYEYLYYEDNKWHMYLRPVDNPYEKVEVFLKTEHVSPFFEDDEDVTFEDIKEAYSH